MDYTVEFDSTTSTLAIDSVQSTLTIDATLNSNSSSVEQFDNANIDFSQDGNNVAEENVSCSTPKKKAKGKP